MNNIETSSGQTQSLLKIRRADSLGNYSWDTSASPVVFLKSAIFITGGDGSSNDPYTLGWKNKRT